MTVSLYGLTSKNWSCTQTRELCGKMKNLSSKIVLVYKDKLANLKSLINVLSLQMQADQNIEIIIVNENYSDLKRDVLDVKNLLEEFVVNLNEYKEDGWGN